MGVWDVTVAAGNMVLGHQTSVLSGVRSSSENLGGRGEAVCKTHNAL